MNSDGAVCCGSRCGTSSWWPQQRTRPHGPPAPVLLLQGQGSGDETKVAVAGGPRHPSVRSTSARPQSPPGRVAKQPSPEKGQALLCLSRPCPHRLLHQGRRDLRSASVGVASLAQGQAPMSRADGCSLTLQAAVGSQQAGDRAHLFSSDAKASRVATRQAVQPSGARKRAGR